MNPTERAKKYDPTLLDAAERFISRFNEAAAQQTDPKLLLSEGKGFSLGAAGAIVMSDELSDCLRQFVGRAARMLGPAAAHEKAIRQTATQHAHDRAAEGCSIKESARQLIDAVLAEGVASYRYVAPNRLFRFGDDTADIQIGRVRAMLTKDFAKARAADYPDHQVRIRIAKDFDLRFLDNGVDVAFPPLCWVVDVDAAAQNVEEEGKWLIDVAVSFLRLSHRRWRSHFPRLGDIESHPINETRLDSEGMKFRDGTVLLGGTCTPSWYQIDSEVISEARTDGFREDAATLFSPPARSLAERVSQGLGWLTRGRQAQDRSERFLFFVTSIEALLSHDDKSSPITQTISRHASVLLSNDVSERAKIAAEIKGLYSLRSALVHAGKREVLWSSANHAQLIAESLYMEVLEKADFSQRYNTFYQEVSACSYGSAWPPD